MTDTFNVYARLTEVIVQIGLVVEDAAGPGRLVRHVRAVAAVRGPQEAVQLRELRPRAVARHVQRVRALLPGHDTTP